MLYDEIQKDAYAKENVKLIAIGAKNDSFEIDFYRNEYKVIFPLFEDKELKIHEKIGAPATPFFIALELNGRGNNKVIHTLLGGFKSPEVFLKTILAKSGLR